MRCTQMAIDHSFIIKKLQGLPEMFVIFSQSTKHPYVTCNEESFETLMPNPVEFVPLQLP